MIRCSSPKHGKCRSHRIIYVCPSPFLGPRLRGLLVRIPPSSLPPHPQRRIAMPNRDRLVQSRWHSNMVVKVAIVIFFPFCHVGCHHRQPRFHPRRPLRFSPLQTLDPCEAPLSRVSHLGGGPPLARIVAVRCRRESSSPLRVAAAVMMPVVVTFVHLLPPPKPPPVPECLLKDRSILRMAARTQDNSSPTLPFKRADDCSSNNRNNNNNSRDNTVNEMN